MLIPIIPPDIVKKKKVYLEHQSFKARLAALVLEVL